MSVQPVRSSRTHAIMAMYFPTVYRAPEARRRPSRSPDQTPLGATLLKWLAVFTHQLMRILT